MDDVYFKMLGELKTMDKWDEQRYQAKATPPTTANTTFVQETREEEGTKEPAPFEEEFFKDMTIDISGNPGDSRSTRKAPKIFGPDGPGQGSSSEQFSGANSLNPNLTTGTPQKQQNNRFDPRQGISEADQAAMNSFASFGTITGPPEVQSQRNGDEFEFKTPQPRQNSQAVQSKRQPPQFSEGSAQMEYNGTTNQGYENRPQQYQGQPAGGHLDNQQQPFSVTHHQQHYTQQPFSPATPFDEDDQDDFGGFNGTPQIPPLFNQPHQHPQAPQLPETDYTQANHHHQQYNNQHQPTVDTRQQQQQQQNGLSEIEFDFSKAKHTKGLRNGGFESGQQGSNPFAADDLSEVGTAGDFRGLGLEMSPGRPTTGFGVGNGVQTGYSNSHGGFQNTSSGSGGGLIRNPAPELDLLGMDLVVPPSGNTLGDQAISSLGQKAASQTASNPFEDDADPVVLPPNPKQEVLQDFCELTQKECLQYFETNDPQRPVFKVKGLVSARGFRRDPKKPNPAFVDTLGDFSSSRSKQTVGLIQL